MKVVLGVGGSEDSVLALRRTLRRTARTGDELTIAVLENPATTRTPASLEAEIEVTLNEYDVDARIARLEGEPGPSLAEFAEAGGYDRIVLGGGKRSPMGKIAPGQIAEFVLLNADTSVLLIR